MSADYGKNPYVNSPRAINERNCILVNTVTDCGIVTWYRTLEGINTFNRPAYACGCEYIQAGTISGRSVLGLQLYPLLRTAMRILLVTHANATITKCGLSWEKMISSLGNSCVQMVHFIPSNLSEPSV